MRILTLDSLGLSPHSTLRGMALGKLLNLLCLNEIIIAIRIVIIIVAGDHCELKSEAVGMVFGTC